MPNPLLEKAQKLGIQPATSPAATSTNPLLLKAQQLGMKPGAPTQSAAPEQPGFLRLADAADKQNHAMADVVIGAGKQIGSIGFSIGKLADKLRSGVSSFFGGKELAKPILTEKPDWLNPTNTPQKVGYTGAELAEYLLPGKAVSGGVKAIEGAASAAKAGKLATGAAKLFGRAALEGSGATAVRLAQNGGDVKDAAKTGAVVGALSIPMQGVAALGKTIKNWFPEKAYSQIYRNAYDDMSEALRTGALKDLQKTDPERFAELVKEGIIKAGKNGVVEFDPTLAREALDRGLKGSLKNMSNVVVRKTLDLEQQARQITAAHTEPVSIPEPNKYVNLLKQVKAQYKGTFLEARAAKADEFVGKVKSGNMSAEDTLSLRRFLDRMRVASSYRPNTHLSIAQEDFKAATDKLRGVLNEVPGMEPVMNNYRFYIDALNSLAREASKRNNSAIINLIDTALFGFGGAVNGPGGAAAFPLVRRALTLPSLLTQAGSAIEKAPAPSEGFGRLLRGAAAKMGQNN